ncbi:serine hydrolase domain-containing protein [Sphingomonas lycopersici]|uniref:Beta-lactamase family protein n=1 Tax=Sphingomonas lycopersici TaxID=2951807 RepID=A0AA41Z557_9SPHN|nr:serine hydrolase domain-containing protein [Sphingomonas lycopersici]MCW6533740.1 beta-lactamase family protein [Sphingomonas lycopersici]
MSDNFAVSGLCDPRFAAVREAFHANFTERNEIGAAVAVIVNGKVVVDLIGGWRDAARTQPWQPDTLVNVWSSTKGIAATCFAMLVDAGRLSYDDPVARYWPEFAAEGKATITIGQLLSHQAGLCGFTTPARFADLLGGGAAAARLAAQVPLWRPGTASGYHAISVGILATELFGRITGTSLRSFVVGELRQRHGFDISIGLGADDEHRRAEMIAPPDMDSSQVGSLTAPQIAALANPPLDPLAPNTPEWRAADLPSANGYANAHGLASLYAALLDGRLVSRDSLERATRTQIEGVDLVLGLPVRWGAGFLMNTDGIYGPNPAAFGHSGWGGSFAMGDPGAQVAMSYTMNRMGAQLRDDPRAKALINALYAAIN